MAGTSSIWNLCPGTRRASRSGSGSLSYKMRSSMHHRLSLHDLLARITPAGAFLSLLLLLCSPIPLQAEWTLFDGARVHPDYHGPVPKKSDVIFSTRFKREDSLDAIKSFRATRVEWVYSTDEDFIKKIKDQVGWFGGAMSGTLPLPSTDGLARDFDGNPIGPPWLKPWGAASVTTTHVATRDFLMAFVQRYIELGADSIQLDDVLLQLGTAEWGGDFSASSLAGFEQFLTTYPDKTELKRLGMDNTTGFDYRQYLKTGFSITKAADYRAKLNSIPSTKLWRRYLQTTVKAHVANLRRYIDEQKGKRFPLSMNLTGLSRPDKSNRNFFLSPYADYALAETPIGNNDDLLVRAATLRALGIGYVPSIMPKSLAENRQAIATLYALGAQPLVPWDIFVNGEPGQPATRFFGLPEDYGDLYEFVLNNADSFDDYEYATVVGIVIPLDKYSDSRTMRFVQRLSKNQVPFAFVLVGGNDESPIVESQRLSRFRTLVMVNPETDFTPADILALRSSSVKLVHASELSDHDIKDLSPLVLDSIPSGVKFFPRASTSKDSTNFIFHFINEHPLSGLRDRRSCERKIEISSYGLVGHHIKLVTLRDLQGSRMVSYLEKDKSVETIISLCSLWGILELRAS